MYGQPQYLMNIQAFVAYLQNALLVARAFTFLAHQLHIGQELHLHRYCPAALSGFASPSRNVERKMARRISAAIRFGSARKQVADDVKSLDVSDWIRSWRSADRRLVHHHDAG